MSSPTSAQVPRTCVMFATTSIAFSSRLVAGSNSVMSPVPAATPTVGQAERTAVMPPSTISPLPAQPDRINARAQRPIAGVFTRTRTFVERAGPAPARGRRCGAHHRNRLSRAQAIA
ncbi:hypothetical protein WR25_13302 [Diploscapter pachys]|uniref:Uncharacterized protein n=1 Tax=Diploscapter pachys TaxID=2018661 RepID=A0A2A2M2P8_9BILA|nr:hypothetical protein WR25_13302 [Diploscapter pachys]